MRHEIYEENELVGVEEITDVVTPEQIAAELEAAVQGHLDATARSAGYDSMWTAVTYADEPAVPKFQAEGQALRRWRSLVWVAANQVKNEVAAGARAIPTSTELIALLPILEMPS